MSQTNKISVILPVYNGIKYLQQSVELVSNQDITDFDFLICYDSTTNES